MHNNLALAGLKELFYHYHYSINAMDVQSTIIKLIRYTAKGLPGEALQSVRLLEGLGMEGDFHAQGGERQLSLLCLEQRQWMDEQAEPGLCFKRYKENILLDGLPPAILVPGIRLKAGEALLEISDAGKHCFEECPLFSTGRHCVLANRKLFAKVARGGLVKTGDAVEEEKP